MTNASNPSLASAIADHDARTEPALNAAAQRVLAEVDAIREDDLEPINRDVDTVATTVLGASRQIAKFLPQLATMPGFDIEAARKLADYAYGLLYWNASASYAAPPKPEIAAMVERGIALRERTLHDLRGLVLHGLLPGSLLEEFGGTTGYRKVAHDLIGMSNLVHERWSTIGGKTLITLAGMDDATNLAANIMDSVGDRDVAKAEVARDTVRRNKAYTLVLRTYDEIRGAMAYIRRVEGDAETYAPTLFPGGRGQTRAKKEAPAAGQTQPTTAPNALAAAAASGALGPAHTNLIFADDASS